MMSRKKLKNLLIDTNLYYPLRKFYHRFFPTEYGHNHRQQIQFYSQFLSPGDLCFDVGANVGAKSEVFLDLGARVVAVEPQSSCLRELQARCGFSSRLTVIAAAVGKQVGEVSFFISKKSATSSLLLDWPKEIEQTIQVPVITLDNIIAKYGIPKFCKIDVEGFELEVLDGLSQPIPMVSLEYHLDDRKIEKTYACLSKLATWGSLSINLTHGERSELAWKEWITYEQFRHDFPKRAPRSLTCGYGDILIRMETC